jgi:hypothetical protein
MTDAEPELTILALNSGSSSLKFGLYRVGSARTDVLLSGAAESIGDREGKFFAQDSRNDVLLSETMSIPSQREAIVRIGRLRADSKTSLSFAVADDTGDNQVGIVERGPISVGQRIAELAAFVDRPWRFRRDVTWNAVGPGELAEQPLHPVPATINIRVDL